jgi:hypothetical protein
MIGLYRVKLSPDLVELRPGDEVWYTLEEDRDEGSLPTAVFVRKCDGRDYRDVRNSIQACSGGGPGTGKRR